MIINWTNYTLNCIILGFIFCYYFSCVRLNFDFGLFVFVFTVKNKNNFYDRERMLNTLNIYAVVVASWGKQVLVELFFCSSRFMVSYFCDSLCHKNSSHDESKTKKNKKHKQMKNEENECKRFMLIVFHMNFPILFLFVFIFICFLQV